MRAFRNATIASKKRTYARTSIAFGLLSSRMKEAQGIARLGLELLFWSEKSLVVSDESPATRFKMRCRRKDEGRRSVSNPPSYNTSLIDRESLTA